LTQNKSSALCTFEWNIASALLVYIFNGYFCLLYYAYTSQMTSSAMPNWQNLKALVSSPSITSSLAVRPPTPEYPESPIFPDEFVPAIGHVVKPHLAPHIRARGRPIWYINLQSTTTLLHVNTRLRILFLAPEHRIRNVVVKKFWQRDEEHTVVECFVENDLNALLVSPQSKVHLWPPSMKEKIFDWFSCGDTQVYFADT
jgi:hypothetical protein